MAKKKNMKSVMILEDDCLFTRKPILELPPENWDMLYLGGNFQRKVISEYCISTNIKNVFKCNNVKTTHAYIINSKLFSKIIKDLESYSSEIDNYYYEEIQSYYNTFIYDPIIVTQRNCFSNILNTNIKSFN